MDTKQNISSIRHFLKKRHWLSDVFAGMCLLVNPLWDKIVAAIDRSWHDARHQFQTLRTSQKPPALSASKDPALENSAVEYQYYRQRALVSGEVTPDFNSLQHCPGNNHSAFPSSSASKEADDEAEYRDYRKRALGLPHLPPLEQIMTPEDVRVSTRTELPRENVLPCPRKEELLEKVPDYLPSEPLEIILSCPLLLKPALVSLRMDEPIDIVPASPLPNALVSPLTLSVDPFFGLGHFSLLNLYSSLPTWSRTKWWSSFFKHSSHLLSCAPILITSILGTSLPRGRYPVPRGTCLVGSSSPGGGTRVPFYLVGDVVAY